MKIKNLITIIIGIISLFSNNAYTTNNYLVNFTELTPLEYSNMSIKYYINTENDQNCTNITKSNSKSSQFNRVLSKYVKEIYNNNSYANFLSQNGTHFVEFLELSNELNLDEESIYTCIRLFHNKIKSCIVVDDNVLNQMLDSMPELMERYFVKTRKPFNLKLLKQSIDKIIMSKLSSYSQNLQMTENNLFNNLSKEIFKNTKKEFNAQKRESEDIYKRERLRSLIIKFIELTISKLIWNHKNYSNIWSSLLNISNNLLKLAEYKIIDHMDDLDDLLWSLVHRFIFFLDLVATQLPSEFFEEAENYILNGTVFFLELEEQDKGIKTKKEFFLQALIDAKTRSLAFREIGIF